MSIFITLTIITLILRSFMQIIPSWSKVYQQTALLDVGHYIMEIMEKNIVYETSSATISKDSSNKDKLVCQTVYGDLIYTFSCEKNYIYKTTTKASTSGKNPLYVSSCKVLDWHLQKLRKNELLVEITLEQDNKQVNIRRIFSLINGSIIDYGS